MAAEGSKFMGRRLWVALGVVAVVAVAGYFTWRALAPREGTDDAQVSGHVSPVATRVGGTVLAIKIVDNQSVKAGDVLVELDPRDYQLAVARAEADFAAAQAAARASHSDVPITSSSARSGPAGRAGRDRQCRRRPAGGGSRDRGVTRQGGVGGSAARADAGRGDTRQPGSRAPGAARGEGRDSRSVSSTPPRPTSRPLTPRYRRRKQPFAKPAPTSTSPSRGARRPKAWCNSPGRRRRLPRLLRSRLPSSKHGRLAPTRK